MPRRALHDSKGLIFHVLNRSVRKVRIFGKSGDYEAFEKLLAETLDRVPTRLLAYCVMPTHWHLLVWPHANELPRFMHRLTLTHAKRWHKAHGTEGTGPVYQRRYTAVPVQTETHLLTVLRYVERNPVRAGLVSSAQEWRWSSLWQRLSAVKDIPLTDWPVSAPPPADWLEFVDRPHSPTEIAALRKAVSRGWPIGDAAWREAAARRLGMNLRDRGRPRRKETGFNFPE